MTRIFIVLISIFTLAVGSAQAQPEAQKQRHFNLSKQHVALEGYDPVSYFQGSKPAKGSKQFSQNREGVTYHFANAKNRELFAANPQKYEPAYGGWCAYAMAEKGEKVSVDPLTYKISNGRLLLFYNQFFTNTLESWNGLKTPENELLGKADQSWKSILSK